MQANNRDAASAWDMLQAICHIQEFTAGLPFDGYQASLLVQSAVERQLEILGETASRVSDGLRQSHPQILIGIELLACGTSSFIATTKSSKTLSGILSQQNWQPF
jgi:hypothetical protein